MQNTAMNTSIDTDSVRIKAYELWLNGGKRDGVADQNWLEAERILRSTEAPLSMRSVTNATQAAVAPKVEAQSERIPATQDVSPSSPPLALSEIPGANKPNAKSAKGSGRKR